jgi:hypothetical protein
MLPYGAHTSSTFSQSLWMLYNKYSKPYVSRIFPPKTTLQIKKKNAKTPKPTGLCYTEWLIFKNLASYI